MGAPAATAQQEDGFFRPSPDPAITRIPLPPRPARDAAPAGADIVVEAAPGSVELALDRAQREHEAMRADAMRRPLPAIVSPLDGTAPIQSPLDGTAPIQSPLDGTAAIISPIGR